MSNSLRRLADTRTARTAALTLAGALALSVALAAPAHAADTTKPAMSGNLGFAPDTVDTTRGDAVSTATVNLSDASGVVSAVLTLAGPDGATEVNLDLSAGTAANGTWTAPQTFSYWDTPGRSTPTSLVATDTAGNSATFTTGLGTGVSMTRTTDGNAPALLGSSSTTTRIDTTAGPADVVVRIDASDDLAGVAGGRVVFTSPDGQDNVEGYLGGSPVQGTAASGSWDVPVTFPARSAPGVWRLTDLSVADAQANERYYSGDDEEFTPLSVRVTTAADTAAPALTSFTVGPAKRSTAYGRNGTVYAAVGFSDATSGVASVQVTLLRPSGVAEDADAEPVVLTETDLKTGTSKSGSVIVPLYVEGFTTGTWKVASVVIDDVAGNTTTVGTAQLPGNRTTFEVSSAAADTLSPTASGYVFSPGTLDTRAAAQTGSLLVAATDPDAVASGIASGTATLTSPSGLQTAKATFTGDDVVTGDQANGTFRAGFALPRNAEDGTWTVTSLAITDAAKRTATVTSFANATPLTVQGQGRAPATPPGAPAMGTATLTGTTASVNWTAPSDNGGAVVKRYLVTTYRDGTATGTPASATTSPFSISNLQRGRSYTFTVAAENAAGTGAASAASNAVTPAPVAPAAPTIGRAELSDPTTATIAWTAPADDGGAAISGYRITPFLNGTAQPVVSADASTTSASVGNLARGRSYTFKVAAANTAGTGTLSAASNTVSIAATVPATPAKPAGTAAAKSVTVRWTAPNDGGSPVTGYQVDGVAADGTPAGGCKSTTTTCTVGGLTAGTSYSFTVTAANAVGASGVSEASDAVEAGEAVQQPQQRATQLAITSAPASTAYGKSMVVTGRLTSSGAAVGRQVVKVQYRKAGTNGTWGTAAAYAVTAANGTARVNFTPPQSVQIRLAASESSSYENSFSAARTVTVTRQVTLAGKRGTAKRGSKVTFSGRANPVRSGAVMQLQRFSGGKWRGLATKRVTGSNYRITVKAKNKGRFAYRVVAVADRAYGASISQVRSFRTR